MLAPIDTPPKRASWAVLLYLAGGCELEPFMTERLWELEAGSFETEVLVQLARAPQDVVAALTGRGATGLDGDWSGVRRYRLKPRPAESEGAGNDSGNDDRNEEARTTFRSECLQDLGHVNMADPRTLCDFVRWGLGLAGAEHAILILAGHGAGLFGALTDLVSGPPQIMGIAGTAQALSRAQAEAGRGVDILVLDTCYMNLVEAAYELAVTTPKGASYLVVPVDSSPLAGLPYELLLETLEAVTMAAGDGEPQEPEAVATQIVLRLNHRLACEGFPSGLACVALDRRLFDLVATSAASLASCLAGSSSAGNLAYPLRLARLHNLIVACPDLAEDPCAGIVSEFRARLAETVICAPAQVASGRRHKCYSMYLPVPGTRVTPECGDLYQELAFPRDSGLADIIAPRDRFPRQDPPPDPGRFPPPTALPARIFAPSPFDAGDE